MKNVCVSMFCVVATMAICIGAILFLVRNTPPDTKPVPVLVEDDYTKEQKAVLAEMKQMRTDLEKAKAEITMLVDQSKATAISKGLDTNVHTDWIVYGHNGQYAIRTGTAVPVAFGFRSDHMVMWKYSDDKE
jgi:hypothetical protein